MAAATVAAEDIAVLGRSVARRTVAVDRADKEVGRAAVAVVDMAAAGMVGTVVDTVAGAASEIAAIDTVVAEAVVSAPHMVVAAYSAPDYYYRLAQTRLAADNWGAAHKLAGSDCTACTACSADACWRAQQVVYRPLPQARTIFHRLLEK